jgi:hypothetical protein
MTSLMFLVNLQYVTFSLKKDFGVLRRVFYELYCCISAGITTVLTMTFLGLEARKDLPKVRVYRIRHQVVVVKNVGDEIPSNCTMITLQCAVGGGGGRNLFVYSASK